MLCEKKGIVKSINEICEELNFAVKEVNNKKNSIVVLAKKECKLDIIQEERHLSVCRVNVFGEKYLLFIVHLTSAVHKEESARNDRLLRISGDIENLEKEESKELEDLISSVVVGDFNLHPYSRGIIGAGGLNATMSKERARKGKRIVDGEERRFFYNPMWALMGADKVVQGTYYNDNDSQDESMYWYTWDQVLIRAGLIDKFPMEELKIVENIGANELVTTGDVHKIDKKRYSDHLPIVFEIR